MRSATSKMRQLVLFCLLLVGMPQLSHAFYTWQGDEASMEIRGLIRGFGIALQNPDDPFFFTDRNVSGLAGVGRLILDAETGGRFSFEEHAVVSYIPGSLQSAGSRFATQLGVERSDALDWRFDGRQAHVFFDRLNMQYASGRLNIKAGRQPINLAATFYFTPNDFFAPFAAQAFFRAYKPGVDAIRIDTQWGELSQLSLFAVLGYEQHTLSDSGWSSRPDDTRASYLARGSFVLGDFEWAVLGGVVRKGQIVGGDFQGELFEWLGVRGEGHVTFPDSPLQSSFTEFSVGLEHRWESSLTLRMEQFYHGGGAASVNEYSAALLSISTQATYLARHYTALGAAYEITPLLNADIMAIHNWVDDSSLLALYAVYSLADESELALGANLPLGDEPLGPAIRSEFGLYPWSFNIELRVYF
ncbi:MAG: hypothetical protein R8K46_02720 [Mariprofundaceae bacterium]